MNSEKIVFIDTFFFIIGMNFFYARTGFRGSYGILSIFVAFIPGAITLSMAGVILTLASTCVVSPRREQYVSGFNVHPFQILIHKCEIYLRSFKNSKALKTILKTLVKSHAIIFSFTGLILNQLKAT